jgi:hypothetical protein
VASRQRQGHQALSRSSAALTRTRCRSARNPALNSGARTWATAIRRLGCAAQPAISMFPQRAGGVATPEEPGVSHPMPHPHKRGRCAAPPIRVRISAIGWRATSGTDRAHRGSPTGWRVASRVRGPRRSGGQALRCCTASRRERSRECRLAREASLVPRQPQQVVRCRVF